MTRKGREMAIAAYNADECRFHNTCFYGHIRPRANGEFTLTIYAVNWTKTYGFRVTKVNRSWSDRPYYVCKNVWRSMWGGIHVEFDERRNRPQESYGWYNGMWGGKVSWTNSGAFWYAPWVGYINLDAIKETRYKYCGFEHYAGGMSLVEYCALWDRHKGIELLSKAGLHQFVTERLATRLERDKKFAIFVRANAKEISTGANGRPYRPRVVVRAFKNGWTLDKAYRTEYARYALNLAPSGVDRVKLLDYLTKNRIATSDYYGYCRDVERAKADILAFGVTFPRDFHNARRKMQRRIAVAQAKADKERTAALERLASRINALLSRIKTALAWRVGDFSVIVPTTRKDFTNEQNRMHNCIGGYFDDCADGKRMCFFVNCKGRRVADVEISTSSGKVLQCYGKHNTETDSDTRKYAAIVGKRIASMLRKDKAKKAA